jgi:shikimate kinase
MGDTNSNVAGLQRIFLMGLSGSGKTTIGRRMADLLGWSFVDTDDMLAERVGMSVGQILIGYGEERFRQLESEVLHDLADRGRVVISIGGGMVILEANRKFMRGHGLTVYLQVSVETAWQRMQESAVQIVRPLVAGENGQQRLHDLYAIRRKWYEEAEIHLNTEEDSYDVLARQLTLLALARNTE